MNSKAEEKKGGPNRKTESEHDQKHFQVLKSLQPLSTQKHPTPVQFDDLFLVNQY